MREVPFVPRADDLALAMSHLAQSSSASRFTAGRWRGDPKHKWHLALRYRHFSLPQSSSASRLTAGAATPLGDPGKVAILCSSDSLSLSFRS
jgi:hypothetical protein